MCGAARQYRGRRSARWLSERTAELGYRISPQTIARMDAGRRAGHFEVAELLVLARALGVPPMLLLYPGLLAGEVEVTPDVRTSSLQAARWFSGLAAFLGKDGQGRLVAEREEWEQRGQLPVLAARFTQLTLARLGMRKSRTGPAERVHVEALVQAQQVEQAIADDLHDLARQIIQAGGIPFDPDSEQLPTTENQS